MPTSVFFPVTPPPIPFEQQLPSRFFYSDSLVQDPSIRRYDNFDDFITAAQALDHDVILEMEPGSVLFIDGSYLFSRKVTIYAPNGTLNDIDAAVVDLTGASFTGVSESDGGLNIIGCKIQTQILPVTFSSGLTSTFSGCVITQLSVFLTTVLGESSTNIFFEETVSVNLDVEDSFGALALAFDSGLAEGGNVYFRNGCKIKHHPSLSPTFVDGGTSPNSNVTFDDTCQLVFNPNTDGFPLIMTAGGQIQLRGTITLLGTGGDGDYIQFFDDTLWLIENMTFSSGWAFYFYGMANPGLRNVHIAAYPNTGVLPVEAVDLMSNPITWENVTSVDVIDPFAFALAPEVDDTYLAAYKFPLLKAYYVPPRNGANESMVWRGEHGGFLMGGRTEGSEALSVLTGYAADGGIRFLAESITRVQGSALARAVNDDTFALFDFDIVFRLTGIVGTITYSSITSPAGTNVDGYILDATATDGILILRGEYPGGDTLANWVVTIQELLQLPLSG